MKYHIFHPFLPHQKTLNQIFKPFLARIFHKERPAIPAKLIPVNSTKGLRLT